MLGRENTWSRQRFYRRRVSQSRGDSWDMQRVHQSRGTSRDRLLLCNTTLGHTTSQGRGIGGQGGDVLEQVLKDLLSDNIQLSIGAQLGDSGATISGNTMGVL